MKFDQIKLKIYKPFEYCYTYDIYAVCLVYSLFHRLSAVSSALLEGRMT